MQILGSYLLTESETLVVGGGAAMHSDKPLGDSDALSSLKTTPADWIMPLRAGTKACGEWKSRHVARS